MFGQESQEEFCIGFHVGDADIEASYGNNAERLSELVRFIEDVQNCDTLDLVEVNFCGSASPEGSIGINRKLAEQRRTALENYVRKRIQLPDSIVTRCDEVFPWERLALLVEQSEMPHKEEAVDVLRNVPESTYDSRGVLVDSKKKQLMDLQYGRSWNYMLEHFYPLVRNATVIFVTVRRNGALQEAEEVRVPAPEEISAPPAVQPADSTVLFQEPEAEVAVQPAAKKPFYMAVKTNMLFDAAAVPNVGIEFHLGKNWSVAGNWMYAWWNSDSRHRFWRAYGGDVAVRKWFGKKAAEKPLTGHHLGIYGQIFTYDFEWGGMGYLGGQPGGTLWDSPNYAAGIEYGYSLPIARRLNLDFTIGAGYWGGKYYEYVPLDGHYVWQTTMNRHWFGPTKAEISLVWLLGRGNHNDR